MEKESIYIIQRGSSAVASPVMLLRDFWSQPRERIWKGLARKSSPFSTIKESD